MSDTSTLSQPIQFTYEDYLHFSEDERYEIIAGEVFMVPAPLTYHQKVSGNIFLNLWEYVNHYQLGELFYAPIDVVLSNIDVVQPDIIFISNERFSIITDKNIQGAPDLVIEIVSPSTSYKDRVLKNKLYSQYGVKEYWVVDPDVKQIEVRIPQAGILTRNRLFSLEETLESPLLPGFTLPLSRIF